MKAFTKCLGLMFFCGVSWAQEARLTITTPTETKTYTTTELLNRPDVETLSIPVDPVYDYLPTQYQAIPVAKFFPKIEGDVVIEFKALDGYAAPLPQKKLLNEAPSESIAYIAIEPAQKKWPAIKKLKSGASAGPFYVVWKNPELSQISPNEWPYMLSSLEVKGSLESVHPKIFPDKKLAKNHPAQAGFQVFLKNCFPCHSMNKQGASKLGPDLNLPMNPTEYFSEKIFRKFVRDPLSVREWPTGIMRGFPTHMLSEADLNHLISYFKHMAKKK